MSDNRVNCQPVNNDLILTHFLYRPITTMVIGDSRLHPIREELRLWLRGDVTIIILPELTIRMAKMFILDECNKDLLPSKVICVAVEVQDVYDDIQFQLLAEQVEATHKQLIVVKGHPFDAHALSIDIKGVL